MYFVCFFAAILHANWSNFGRDDRGKRIYYTAKLGREQMREIYRCVLHGIGMGFLCQYVI